MNRVDIVKAFNPSLDKANLDLIDKLATSEENALQAKELVHQLETFITTGLSGIKNRAEELEIKINSALFGNKKFINESYAFEIPLKEDYFLNPDTVSFKENILTTKVSKNGVTSKVQLNPSNITSRKNTDFKFVNNQLYIKKNEKYSYQELEISIPKTISSGYLHLDLSKYDNISVLDRFGRELLDKEITNKVYHLVTKDTKSLVIRFHTNKDKNFIVENFYITEENFSLTSEIKTKPIRIGYNLKQLAINTCDNYSDTDINIQYEISINSGLYRPIRPLNKQKNIDLNSILSVIDQSKYYNLTQTSYIHDKMLFETTEIDVLDFHVIQGFNYKLGEDEGLIRDRTIYLNLTKDDSIILNKDDSIKVNDETFTAPEDNYSLKLNKGLIKLEIPSELLKESENFLNKSNIKISSDYSTMSFHNKLNGKEYTKLIDFNPLIKEKNSLIYQLVSKGDIFLEPVEVKKISINNTLYIEKKNALKNLHLFVKHRVSKVDRIQLRIKLESNNKENPAYISSLTIRGV